MNNNPADLQAIVIAALTAGTSPQDIKDLVNTTIEEEAPKVKMQAAVNAALNTIGGTNKNMIDTGVVLEFLRMFIWSNRVDHFVGWGDVNNAIKAAAGIEKAKL